MGEKYASGVSNRMPLVLVGVLAGVLGVRAAVQAQANPNQFGAQDRVDAAGRMIVLGVQQGISSLPPTSGQSFSYEFDPELDTYVASGRLGPTSLRSPQTIGAGKFSFRLSTSFFELADTFGPITHVVNDPPGTPIGVAKLGLRVDATVGLVNLAANYGLSDRFEIMVNLPVVIVDASARQTFTTRSDALDLPPSMAPLSGPGIMNGDVRGAVDALDQALQPGGGLSLREESFGALGFDFSQATQAGVGRISIGVKGLLYSGKRLQLAFAPEFFFPSPNEDEFAGSETGAILPRAVASFSVAEWFKLYMDAGYDYDFDTDELRRFVWNAGTAFPMKNFSIDFGVGGSKFNQGVEFTPDRAPFVDTNGNPGTIAAIESNKLGSNFVDFLGGIKIRLGESTVLSGSVNVPVNSEGFRATAVGTVALEQYF